MKKYGKTFYKHILNGIIMFSLYSMCSCSEPLTFLPKEVTTHIIQSLNFLTRHTIRSTCHSWKNIIDADKSNFTIITLLRSLPTATNHIKTRILFYAIHHNLNDLTHHVLKKYHEQKSSEKLYFQPIESTYIYDPYCVAKVYNNNIIINILEHYGYNKCSKKRVRQWPTKPLLQKLLISTISGDDTLFDEAIKKLITEYTFDPSKNENGTYYIGHTTRTIIENSESIIIQHDNQQCIISLMPFIQKFPAFAPMTNDLIHLAYRKESINVFTELIKNHPAINAIGPFFFISSGTFKHVTIKEQIINAYLKDNKSHEYKNLILSIFNQYGAKTTKELKTLS